MSGAKPPERGGISAQLPIAASTWAASRKQGTSLASARAAAALQRIVHHLNSGGKCAGDEADLRSRMSLPMTRPADGY